MRPTLSAARGPTCRAKRQCQAWRARCRYSTRMRRRFGSIGSRCRYLERQAERVIRDNTILRRFAQADASKRQQNRRNLHTRFAQAAKNAKKQVYVGGIVVRGSLTDSSERYRLYGCTTRTWAYRVTGGIHHGGTETRRRNGAAGLASLFPSTRECYANWVQGTEAAGHDEPCDYVP